AVRSDANVTQYAVGAAAVENRIQESTSRAETLVEPGDERSPQRGADAGAAHRDQVLSVHVDHDHARQRIPDRGNIGHAAAVEPRQRFRVRQADAPLIARAREDEADTAAGRTFPPANVVPHFFADVDVRCARDLERRSTDAESIRTRGREVDVCPGAL